MIVGNVDIMPDASEIVHYDDPGLPLYIRRGRLSYYPSYRAAAHWHEDLEFIGIAEGEMNYSVNGEKILLQEGDTLFVNSRQLHFGFDEKMQECIFYCYLIHPSLLYGNSSFLKERLVPLLSDSAFPYFVLRGKGWAAKRARTLLASCWQAKLNSSAGYHIGAVGKMCELTALFADEWKKERKGLVPSAGDSQLDLQRRMVAFVEEHFDSSISVDDIAESASVSKSTCCRMFRKYVSTSPLEFLNSYRLQKSCEMLQNTDLNVTDISLACGFSNASYFAKLFSRSFGVTPKVFRKQTAQTDTA